MKILLVSNMYPDKKHPSYGIFVKKFVDELEKSCVNYDKSVMIQHDGQLKKVAGYLFFYFKTFFKILFGSYGIVYIHYASHSSGPVLAASHLRKIEIYTNVHGSDVVPENMRQEKMQKYTKAVLKKSSKIIVPSEYFKEYIKKKYNLEAKKIFVYPSAGIDKNLFYEQRSVDINRIKESYGFNRELLTFGMAGRISSGKGWDVFVQAVRIVIDRGIKGNFIIVGSGNESEKLDKLIKQNNLEANIIRKRLLSQEDLREFYNAIDYFIFPTKREGESLGLVAIEAMACGTPVIASDFAAPKYYIKDGVNGYKFKMGNAYSLADKIEYISKNRINEQYLRRGALKTASLYNNEKIRFKLKKIFEQ